MATFYFNDGHTYQIVKTAKTWSKAQADAKAAGGSLAIVNSEAENNFILGLAEKEAIKTTAPPAPDGGGARYLWLGATDSAKEGEWKWTDKTSVTYNNWAKPTEPDNYPSNLGDQDGLALGLSSWPANPDVEPIGSEGQWNDINLKNKLFSVIEWKKNAIGSNSADTMVGSTRADKINGGLGNDRLKGGDGADFFVFTTKLNAKSNVDTIEDFVSGTDKIQLENAVFTAFKKAGALAASAFALSGKAEDKSDRIIYKQDTGQLFYDKDGTGKAAAVLFATLENKANLTVNDFTVI